MTNHVQFTVDENGKAKLLVNGHDLTNVATSVTIQMAAAYKAVPKVTIELLVPAIDADVVAATSVEAIRPVVRWTERERLPSGEVVEQLEKTTTAIESALSRLVTE